MQIEVKSQTRIDKYLTSYLDESRSTIQKMLIAGYITVNDKPVKANYELKLSDIVIVKDGFKEECNITPEEIPLNIVYEDDDLMIINKPSGMVVHPGNGNLNGTLVNALMNYTKDLSDVDEIRPGIVHRIDKDTSGLMVVAKNNKCHMALSKMLEDHLIKREYIALLIGELKTDKAIIDAPIGRDINDRKKMAVTDKNGKKAITHLEVLHRYKGYTLVKLNLETGRTHQIRVHMKYIGYPIYNDPVYTTSKGTSFGQFLHSSSIDFIQPITGQHLHFECPLPEEFNSFLKTLVD